MESKHNPTPTDETTPSSQAQARPRLPRQAPLLLMTDLYTTPGSAQEVYLSLADNPLAQQLFAADLA